MKILNKITWARTSLVVLYSQNYAARIHGHYHESSDCFEDPNKSLLKSSDPKEYLPNFPTQKNFKPKKILRSSLSLQIWSTPPGQLALSLTPHIKLLGDVRESTSPFNFKRSAGCRLWFCGLVYTHCCSFCISWVR